MCMYAVSVLDVLSSARFGACWVFEVLAWRCLGLVVLVLRWLAIVIIRLLTLCLISCLVNNLRWSNRHISHQESIFSISFAITFPEPSADYIKHYSRIFLSHRYAFHHEDASLYHQSRHRILGFHLMCASVK